MEKEEENVKEKYGRLKRGRRERREKRGKRGVWVEKEAMGVKGTGK